MFYIFSRGHNHNHNDFLSYVSLDIVHNLVSSLFVTQRFLVPRFKKLDQAFRNGQLL